MAQLKDLIVNGPSRFIGDVYATTFTGNLAGNASTATSATNAGTVGGLSVHSGRNNEANKIVRTDGNGYLQVGYINSSSGHEKNASSPTYVWGSNSSDSYLRSYQTSSLSVKYATTSGSCSGNAATATDSNSVGGYAASDLVKFYLSPMEAGAPASSAKSWFANTMPAGTGAIIYNVPGSEKTIIAGKSTGAFGHMLQLNYDDNYLRILRYYGSNWKTTDWEKISAGYADAAGKWSTPRTITLTGSVTGSVSFDGSANVTLATTTNHTHSYAGSSSAGGAANSARTLVYVNHFDINYGSYAVFQQDTGRSDFPHTGWFNTIKMLHNNSSGYFTEIATSFTGEDGMWRRALQGGVQAGWYKMLDSGNYNSYSPKLDGTGATGTWGINISGNAVSSTKATQDGNGNTITSTYLPVSSGTVNAICSTAADARAKVAVANNFILTTGVNILITFTVANTYKNAMTLDVNGTGVKTLYINDEATSTSNYTIPVGTYNCYYDGANWFLDTGNALKVGTIKINDINAKSGFCLLYGSTPANVVLQIGVNQPNTYYFYNNYSLYMARKGIAVGGFASTSDMTMKDRIEDLHLNFDDVASMPVFKFRWKDSEAHGDNINVGTSAQYWVSKEPLLVDGTEGSYSIQYGVLALACVKTTAEKVKELEDKVLELQEEIKTLKAL